MADRGLAVFRGGLLAEVLTVGAYLNDHRARLDLIQIDQGQARRVVFQRVRPAPPRLPAGRGAGESGRNSGPGPGGPRPDAWAEAPRV